MNRGLTFTKDILQKIIETSPTGIVVLNREGQIIYANSHAIGVLGISKNEIQKRMFDDDQWQIRDLFGNSYLKTELPFAIVKNTLNPVFNIKHSIQTNGSNPILLSINAAPLLDANGQFDGVVCDIKDITQEKKTEETLTQLIEMRTELLRDASHNLKTPLISIKGYTDMLLTFHKEEFSEKTLSMLHYIKEGCEKLNENIKTILERSKQQLTDPSFGKEAVNLSLLIKKSVKELDSQTKLKSLKIILDIPNNLLVVCNRKQIYSVLGNLLTNAIKNTPKNGVIKIHTKREGFNILFSIKDNGIGLSNGEKDHLFKPFAHFNRVIKNSDINTNGTGLGLYLSRKIIKNHGGEIWAESEGRNKGAIFLFKIPISKS
ncbi:MAG: putative Histidine kinase [Promethearchaeota archaeon]|nr:MAG: putative Histidine kinase [Candidatus Lokiarchaeota archaeon]